MSNWPDFEVPKSWRVIEARETATVMKAGGTPSRRQASYWNGDIPFVLIEDMTAAGLYLDHTSERITKAGLDASSAWIVPPGTVLLSMYATIGATVVNRIPLATNQAILAIVPKKDVSAEFLAFCLRAHKATLSARNVQATQKNINKGIVQTFPLPIPPLPEQRKIAGVLGLVQRAMEQQERLIALTTELKRALLHQLFTQGLRGEPQKQTEIGPVPESWEVATMEDIADLRKEIADPTSSSEEVYIGLEHIESSRFWCSGHGHPSEVRSAKNTFYHGDILFGKLRPYLDKAVIAKSKGICSTDILVFTPKEGCKSEFLVCVLHTAELLAYAIKTTSGVNHPRTSWSALKSFRFGLPQKHERDDIAQIMTTLETKILNARRKRILFEALFRTLLYQLMTAQIRVHGLDLPEIDQDGKAEMRCAST